jgi:hypothetical protein
MFKFWVMFSLRYDTLCMLIFHIYMGYTVTIAVPIHGRNMSDAVAKGNRMSSPSIC